MRVSALFFLCISTVGQVMGQSFEIDSLSAELERSNSDTSYIRLLNEIAITYLDHNPDSTKKFAAQALRLSEKIDFRKGQAISLNYLGRYYLRKESYDKAAEYYFKCLAVKDFNEEKRIKAVTYYDLGQMYSRLRSLLQSEELFYKQKLYFEKCIETFRGLAPGERKGEVLYLEAAALTEIGRAFMGRKLDPEKYDSALIYFNKAVSVANELNSFEVLYPALESMGNVHLMQHRYRDAIRVGHQLLSRSKRRSPLDAYMAMSLLNLGQLHRLDDYDSASYYFNSALHEFDLLGDQYKIYTPIVYDQLGQLNFGHKNYDKAIMYFDRVRETAKRVGKKDIEIAHLLTSEAYKALGNYKMALEFQNRYYQLRDSMLNEDTSAKLARLQGDFEIARQKDQIELLEKDAQLKDLLLANKRTQQILIAIIAGLLILLSAGLILRNRAIQRRKNEQEQFFREMDQLKSRFFANISHEFRTPLTLLLGPIEKRLSASVTAEDKTEFSVMHRNASRLLLLVNQLLDLSRFEAGTVKLAATQSDIVKFITHVMSEFHSIAASKSIQFELTAEQPNLNVYFDADKLDKVLYNLLSNAFKFTPQGGQIWVQVSMHADGTFFREGYAEIRVKDTGIGISPEHLPKLFDRFYQVDNSTTREYEGTGIGLALAKELVALHHGRILVESSTGAGSVFIVQLPLGKRHLQPEEITATAEAPIAASATAIYTSESVPTSNGATEDTVLIIEDNADLREHLQRELSATNRVVLARDGEEGIQLALQEIPSLIISDLMMPRKDGMEVCAILKEDERTSHIPFILLTAKAEAESKLKGLRQGADEYLAKPFSMEELRVRIKNSIDVRKTLQKKFAQQVITIKPTEFQAESVEDKFLKKVSSIGEKYLSDPQFSVEVFAREIGMSHAQLYRKMIALTNLSPNEFIRNLRLERASDLLRQRAGNVAEIAYLTGFNNLSYFSKVFKEKFGVSPSEYLKSKVNQVS